MVRGLTVSCSVRHSFRSLENAYTHPVADCPDRPTTRPTKTSPLPRDPQDLRTRPGWIVPAEQRANPARPAGVPRRAGRRNQTEPRPSAGPFRRARRGTPPQPLRSGAAPGRALHVVPRSRPADQPNWRLPQGARPGADRSRGPACRVATGSTPSRTRSQRANGGRAARVPTGRRRPRLGSRPHRHIAGRTPKPAAGSWPSTARCARTASGRSRRR